MITPKRYMRRGHAATLYETTNTKYAAPCFGGKERCLDDMGGLLVTVQWLPWSTGSLGHSIEDSKDSITSSSLSPINIQSNAPR